MTLLLEVLFADETTETLVGTAAKLSNQLQHCLN
jgi:hypothetical protein